MLPSIANKKRSRLAARDPLIQNLKNKYKAKVTIPQRPYPSNSFKSASAIPGLALPLLAFIVMPTSAWSALSLPDL